LEGRTLAVDARGLIDETAGYHARHTAWEWSAGAGIAEGGEAVVWNLVAGVHDAPRASERTVWVDGEPHTLTAMELSVMRALIRARGRAVDHQPRGVDLDRHVGELPADALEVADRAADQGRGQHASSGEPRRHDHLGAS